MAIRFAVARRADIMAISHNGFVVGTGEGFLVLQKAIATTVSSQPLPGLLRLSLEAIPEISSGSIEKGGYPGKSLRESRGAHSAALGGHFTPVL